MRIVVYKLEGCTYCPQAVKSAKLFGERQGLEVEERNAVKHFGELERILKGRQIAIPVTCFADNNGKVDVTKCVIGAENLEERLENALYENQGFV